MSGESSEQIRERRSARRALGLLLVVLVVGWTDRQVLTILLPAIKRELAASDAQLGLLVGLGFTLFYTLLGLPVARWADRGSRRTIISLALALWSAMTALSGLAASYLQLLLARIGVGAGEAGSVPPAHSLLSDLFPPEHRGRAFSIYALGTPIGTLSGLVLGGTISHWLGWRGTFFVLGVPGVLLAIVVRLGLREPPRGRFDPPGSDAGVVPLPQVARQMWRQTALRHVLMGAALNSLVYAAVAGWVPTFMQRVHGWSAPQAGLALGLTVGLAGGLGTLGAGPLCDRLGRGDRRWYLWAPAAAALLVVPLVGAFAFAHSATLALALFAPVTAGLSFYFGPTVAMSQGLVAPRMRAFTSATYQFMSNLIGAALGPFLVGLLSDRLDARLGVDAIRTSLTLVALVNLWTAAHYLRGARTIREDLRASGLQR